MEKMKAFIQTNDRGQNSTERTMTKIYAMEISKKKQRKGKRLTLPLQLCRNENRRKDLRRKLTSIFIVIIEAQFEYPDNQYQEQTWGQLRWFTVIPDLQKREEQEEEE